MPLHPVRVARDAAIERLDELDVVVGQLIDPKQISSLLNRLEAASPDELEELESEALFELAQMGIDEPIAQLIVVAMLELYQTTQSLFELENELNRLSHELGKADRLRNNPPSMKIMRLGTGSGQPNQKTGSLDRRFAR